ncbi:MAG: thioesterase family protein [Bacteroidota bacterium]|nr:thioesterase family protein [Bacteroidota bacterium]
MFSDEVQIRVRYAETDQMGYVYYGNYATYFEVGRVESLRKLGLSYKEMEASGIMLPVLEYHSKFIKPAVYDDLLTIKTIIPELPKVRIHFIYEIYNQQNILLTTGETTLVFINSETKKPCAPPADFLSKIKYHFTDN